MNVPRQQGAGNAEEARRDTPGKVITARRGGADPITVEPTP
ncbi:hypothetical protein [Streptomyces azureus]|nr:hypothetical protein [Streptomyces azureus]